MSSGYVRGFTSRAQAVDNSLAHHAAAGNIRSWQRLGESWAVILTDGQRIDLASATIASAFCHGLTSAEQAARKRT